MKKQALAAIAIAMALGLLGGSVNADQIAPIASLTGSHGGDQYANGMVSLTNGSGITKSDPSDPSTWTFSGDAYQDEWMANYLSGALNSKLAWASFDLGASAPLAKLWLFNTSYRGGISGTATYNLYYADSPAVALPAMPNKGTYSVTGLTPQGDYDFGSGGWTLFNTSGPLICPQSSSSVVNLGGISARYIALEQLTLYSGTRVGFAEVALTSFTPPPRVMVFIVK